MVNQQMRSVTLSEWQSVTPEAGTNLANLSLSRDSDVQKHAKFLTDSGLLEVLQLRAGIAIKSTSFVGRVSLDPIEVTIKPKIAGAPLLQLTRYAYRLRNLKLLSYAGYGAEADTFQDLLISQLASEANELLCRGLHRRYVSLARELASPTGRIEIQKIARSGSAIGTVLPCRYHPRLENHLVNQLLLARNRAGQGHP
ncbi:MAG: 5-methylcytosine restriction system component-like protein [Dehalococcoidia bacterium]|nr:5-methylcytosine restriction system component-like protein [Dehalococcoidia bacterium]